MDEAFLSLTDRLNPSSGARCKGGVTKVLIAIAVEKLQPKGFGRIRMHRIARRGAAELVPFVQNAVEPGAPPLIPTGRQHICLCETWGTPFGRPSCWVPMSRHTNLYPAFHRVAALVKRWILWHPSRRRTA